MHGIARDIVSKVGIFALHANDLGRSNFRQDSQFEYDSCNAQTSLLDFIKSNQNDQLEHLTNFRWLCLKLITCNEFASIDKIISFSDSKIVNLKFARRQLSKAREEAEMVFVLGAASVMGRRDGIH